MIERVIDFLLMVLLGIVVILAALVLYKFFITYIAV